MKSLLMRMSSLFSDEGWSPEDASELDLTQLEGTACYCDKDAESAIEEAIKALPIKALHWIDGGDYHYLSELWMRKLESPTRLLLIDNHPDDQEPSFGGDIISCGGWVAHAKRTNPLICEDSDLLYVSIDLDWLSPDYARTNWNQGTASVQDLLALLDKELAGKQIAGVDICGGISSALGGKAEDFAINLRTRSILQDYFRAF